VNHPVQEIISVDPTTVLRSLSMPLAAAIIKRGGKPLG